MLRQRYVHICMMDIRCQAGHGWGQSFEWPPQKHRLVVHLSKTPWKSVLIKAPQCPFVILQCIINTLQLSVAIRPAFFMQINLTAQQSVSYASPCSLILNSLLHSLGLSLPSTSFSQAFAEVATFALFIIKG